MSDVLNKQVGGNHYKNLKRQPIILCECAGVIGGFSLGNVFKYLCRYPFKGKSLEDLKKALHYIEFHEFKKGSYHFFRKNEDLLQLEKEIEDFIFENQLSLEQSGLLRVASTSVLDDDYEILKQVLNETIEAIEADV